MFTANNFLINQTALTVSDLVLVRTTIQVVLFTIVVISRGESVLPSTAIKRFYTVMQGYVFGDGFNKQFQVFATFLFNNIRQILSGIYNYNTI